MQKIKQNILLFLAIALPFLFIGILFLVSKIPGSAVSSEQNFLYLIYNNSTSGKYFVNYVIEGGKLVRVMKDPQDQGKEIQYIPFVGEPSLFEYDFKNNKAIPITYEEASKKTYSLNYKSNEGYTVNQDYGGGGGFFYSTPSKSSIYIYDTSSNKSKLNIDMNDFRSESFQFIGWLDN